MEENPTQEPVPAAQNEPRAQAGAAPSAAPTPAVAQQATGEKKETGRYEEQIKRLRGQVSAYDRTARGYASQLQDQKRRYEDALRQSQTADMDEQEKAQYEAAFYKQKYGEVQRAVKATQYQMAYSDAMHQWDDYYNGMGIPTEKLDHTSIETMQHSALEAMRDTMQGQNQEGQTGPQNTPPGRVPPPNVATSTPQGTHPGTTRFADIPMNEWEDYYKAVERGQLDPNNLPR